MSIKKKYSLCKNDFVEFIKYLQWKQLKDMPFAVFLLTFGILYLTKSKFDVFTVCWSVAAGLSIIPVIMLSIYFQSNGAYKSYTLAVTEVETEISENGISQISEIGNTMLPYSKIYKIVETRKGFYLFLSKYQAIILSKKDFSTDSEIAAMRKIFSDHMDQKKVKLLN